jgi:hypothetical protein
MYQGINEENKSPSSHNNSRTEYDNGNSIDPDASNLKLVNHLEYTKKIGIDIKRAEEPRYTEPDVTPRKPTHLNTYMGDEDPMEKGLYDMIKNALARKKSIATLKESEKEDDFGVWLEAYK